MKRIICTVICAVMLICSLTGCMPTFDAQAYVQGNIDLVYLNKISDSYLQTVTNTKEELESIYEQGIEVEADYFVSYFYIDLELAPEDTMDRIKELYKEIYSHSKYEVGEAVKSGDDYLVSVTIHPIDIIQKVVTEDWEAFEEEYVNNAEQLATMTDEECEKLWVDSVFELVENRLATIGYLEPQTISIQVVKDADGDYTISENDFGRIDSLIIQY